MSYDPMRAVTVVIPHIPTRRMRLHRALASVVEQVEPARGIRVVTDLYRDGSAITRNRGLHGLDTRWVAFLDDDDELDPEHLRVLLDAALENDVDVVYPGCRVVNPQLGGSIPLQEEWGRFGHDFDADLLREKSYIPVTSLVKSSIAQRALFGPPAGVDSDYDDWGFYLRCLDLGARFLHVPHVTWTWHHHGRNTSGRPDRW